MLAAGSEKSGALLTSEASHKKRLDAPRRRAVTLSMAV
jgi:hypothetical protein